MKVKLTILGFLAIAIVSVSMFQIPAEGDCSTGIKKEHLDKTAESG